jgi:putative ABC transport system substrate-binding protein
MRRIGLAVILTLSLLAAPLAAEAQSGGKTARIGFLGDVPSFLVEAFRQGLHELGYVEGQSIAIKYRFSEGKYDSGIPGSASTASCA